MSDLVLVNSHSFDTSAHLDVADALPFGVFDGAVQHPMSPATGDGDPLILTFFVDDSKWTDGFWDAIGSSQITNAFNRIGESNSSLNRITTDTAVVDDCGSKINVLEQAIGTKVLAQTAYEQLIVVDSGTTAVLDP
jgi:hypothetical protein